MTIRGGERTNCLRSSPGRGGVPTGGCHPIARAGPLPYLTRHSREGENPSPHAPDMPKARRVPACAGMTKRVELRRSTYHSPPLQGGEFSGWNGWLGDSPLLLWQSGLVDLSQSLLDSLLNRPEGLEEHCNAVAYNGDYNGPNLPITVSEGRKTNPHSEREG
jgi:hypothetical protein